MASLKSKWDEIANARAREKKTHVSFPQLKYPSHRDSGMRDSVRWLTGKALDDGAYDVANFLNKHPGGEEWLELTKGTDITEAFESHHLNPAIEKALEKYYVRDAKTPRNSPFTFKDDGFYRTLKREVNKELSKVPKHVSRTADFITDGLFLSLLCSFALACWVVNSWLAQLWYIIASICLALLTVACHNFIHRKTNWRMFLFNLSMWSYRNFRVSHVLSHHLYTNTLMDLEISSLEPIPQYNPRKNKPVCFVSIFVREEFLKKHYGWHDCLGFLLPLWMWLITGSSITKVLYVWFWIICTGSLLFHLIGVNAAHHHPDAIKDGDQPRNETPDWGEHQVEALLDRKDINSNTFAVVTLFGEHALHLMFPTLDHLVLKYLHPLFLQTCDKYKAKYRVSTQFEMVLGQI